MIPLIFCIKNIAILPLYNTVLNNKGHLRWSSEYMYILVVSSSNYISVLNFSVTHIYDLCLAFQKRCEVLCLNSGVDYRMNALPSAGHIYFV